MSQENPGSPKRCLIADDVRSSRELLTQWLEECGFDCVDVVDGNAAWTAFQSHTPDLVITDIEMPGRCGLELLQMVRSDPSPRRSKVPVLVVTSLRDSETLRVVRQLGGNGLLSKPLNKQLLYEAVLSVISNDGENPPFVEKTARDITGSRCVISPTLRRLMRKIAVE